MAPPPPPQAPARAAFPIAGLVPDVETHAVLEEMARTAAWLARLSPGSASRAPGTGTRAPVSGG